MSKWVQGCDKILTTQLTKFENYDFVSFYKKAMTMLLFTNELAKKQAFINLGWFCGVGIFEFCYWLYKLSYGFICMYACCFGFVIHKTQRTNPKPSNLMLSACGV